MFGSSAVFSLVLCILKGAVTVVAGLVSHAARGAENRSRPVEGRRLLELHGASQLEETIGGYVSSSASFAFMSLLLFHFLNVLFSASI